MAAPVTFRFYLFGTLKLYIDESPIALPPQPAALCAFLILNRQRRITREEIQSVFWPEAAPAKAQERLRRTLYLLRQAIHPHTSLIATEGSELAVAPDVNLWVDYETFEKALIDAYRYDPPGQQALAEAVALYRDDLLKDIYTDWVLLEREHARQRFLTALRHLMDACQQAGSWSEVIQYAHLLLEQDPLQEMAHRALMTAYSATGDRSAAVRQYQQCAQILKNELGAEPLAETQRLYNNILQGRGVQTVDVLPPVPVRPLPAATDLQQVPMVGREQELATIAAEWRICQGKHSRLVLITGSAGMGKTRLVEEAASRIPGPSVTVITGNCYAMEAGTPYQLISDLMRKVADRVAMRLDPAARSDLAQLVPALQKPGIPPRTASGPDVTVRLQEVVTRVFRMLASSGDGVWLVTEDLHWADPASLACLNHTLRRCHDLPLMVLATLRDEEVSFDSPLMDWPANSVHAPAPTTHIPLTPLPPDQLHHLLSQLVEQDVAPLVPLLYQETAGNPFFLIETLRALVEQGILVAEPTGRWQLRFQALPQPADLPLSDAVLQVIRGRIRRLSRPAQEVLVAAAVIEHDIEEKLLADLVDPSVPLDLALDEILKALILEETAPGLYQFAHIKVREILYADTSAPRRRFLHHRAAEVLSQYTGSRTLADISRLAYHYAQAREWTQALLHHWRAAQIAQRAGALAEADRYAEMASSILNEYRAELDPTRLPESLASIRFDLLVLQAEFRRQAATAGLYYPPDLIEAIQALLPEVDDSRRARASLQQATHLLGQGNLNGAQEAAERGRGLYARLQDAWGELDAAQHQIDVAYHAGDIITMRRLLQEMRPLSLAASAPQALTRNEMRLAMYENDWMRVLTVAQELLSSQQAHFDPSIAWLSLANLGLAYMKLGAYEEAYTVAQQAVEASRDASVLGLGAQVLLARLELWRGSLQQASRILLDLLEIPNPMMGEAEVVSPALALVRCAVAEGNDENAKRWASRISQAVSRVRHPILYPPGQVAWALAHIAAGRYDDARKRLAYPLEYILLLEDTSPQEIFALRAAAAHGLRDRAETGVWLSQAWETLQSQAQNITDPMYHDAFLNRVPLHIFIARATSSTDWWPEDVLGLRAITL